MISNSIKKSSDRFGKHTLQICVWFFSVNYSDFPIYSRTLLCSGPLNSSSVARMITFVAQVTYCTLRSPLPNENYQQIFVCGLLLDCSTVEPPGECHECYHILFYCYHPFKKYEHNDYSVS